MDLAVLLMDPERIWLASCTATCLSECVPALVGPLLNPQNSSEDKARGTQCLSQPASQPGGKPGRFKASHHPPSLSISQPLYGGGGQAQQATNLTLPAGQVCRP